MKRQIWEDLESIILVEERMYYQLLERPLQAYFREVAKSYAIKDPVKYQKSIDTSNRMTESMSPHQLIEIEEIQQRIAQVVVKEMELRTSLEQSSKSKKELLEENQAAYKATRVKNLFHCLEEDPGIPNRFILDENTSIYAAFKEGDEQFVLKTPDSERFYRISEFFHFQVDHLEMAIMDRDINYFVDRHPGKILESKAYISNNQDQDFLR